MKKYLVILTVENESGNFYVYVSTSQEEKAAEYGRNKFENEYPIYRGLSKVYNVVVQ